MFAFLALFFTMRIGRESVFMRHTAMLPITFVMLDPPPARTMLPMMT
jgi:hypothetical protein